MQKEEEEVISKILDCDGFKLKSTKTAQAASFKRSKKVIITKIMAKVHACFRYRISRKDFDDNKVIGSNGTVLQ